VNFLISGILKAALVHNGCKSVVSPRQLVLTGVYTGTLAGRRCRRDAYLGGITRDIQDCAVLLGTWAGYSPGSLLLY